MFCNNCGNEIENNAKFCPICGASFVQQSQQEAQTAFNQGAQFINESYSAAAQSVVPPKQPKKRSKAKIILLLIVILLVAAMIGGTVFCFTSPAYQLSKSLSEGDCNSALDIYTSSVKDSFVQKFLANQLVPSAVSNIVDGYEDESVSFDEAIAALDTISQMDELDVAEEAAAQSESLQILYASDQAYDLAESYYDAGDYEAAMDAYRNVDESDSEHYEDAQSKIESAKENYRAQIIEKVGSPDTVEEYETAVSLLNSALAVLEEDEELIALRETCESGLKEAAKSTALNEATDAIATGNYEEAFELLETALNSFPEDIDLVALLSSAQSQYVEYVTSQIETLTADGNYEEAFELLETALNSFPENSDLQSLLTSTQSHYEKYITSKVEELTAKSDYDSALELVVQALVVLPDSSTLKELQAATEESQPVKLSVLKISDSYNYEQVEDLTVSMDVIGNVYNPGNLFKISRISYTSGYADYYLNSQYTRLTGTIAVSDESASRECIVTIYGNGNSILYTGTFSRTTAPVTIDINLEDVDWFEIQVDGDSNGMYILLSNFVLYKE